ncbi:MAG: leucine-rich repeat protein [Suipraeoptans sp.]
MKNKREIRIDKNRIFDLVLVSLLMLSLLVSPLSNLTLTAGDVNDEGSNNVSLEDLSGSVEKGSTANISGSITLLPEENILDQYKIIVYDKNEYKNGDEDNKVLQEVVINAEDEIQANEIELNKSDPDEKNQDEEKEQGRFELYNLVQGEYRLEFVSMDEEFEPLKYSLPEVSDDGKEDEYTITLNSAKEDEDYFLYMEVIVKENEEKEYNIELIKEELPLEVDDKEVQTDETKGNDSIEDEPITIEDSRQDEEKDKEEASTPVDQEGTPIGEETKDSEDEDESEESIKIEDLKELQVDEVGAALEAKPVISASLSDELLRNNKNTLPWSLSLNYIEEQSAYHALEYAEDYDGNGIKGTGHVKYQVDFFTRQKLWANAVEIRIPSVIFTNRHGAAVLPTDIAIPRGTKDNPTVSASTRFNWYMDDMTGELVFFNYADILKGTTSGFQVLYSFAGMDVIDGSEWTWKPKVKVIRDILDENEEEEVSVGTEEDNVNLPTLTGKVDTKTTLTSVSKSVDGQGPIHSRAEVISYSYYDKEEDMPTKYQGDGFFNHSYMKWRVYVRGEGNQPAQILIKDETIDTVDKDGNIVAGEVLGIKDTRNSSFVPFTETKYDGYIGVILHNSKNNYEYTGEYIILVAYPKLATNTIVTNKITGLVNSMDNVDDDVHMSSTARAQWVEYKWPAEDGMFRVDKAVVDTTDTELNDQRVRHKGTLESWLEVYKTSKSAGQNLNGLKYTTFSSTLAFSHTHEITGPNAGKKKEGDNQVETSTMDDAMFIQSDTGTARMLTDSDYYYSSVFVRLEQANFDFFQDTLPLEESGPMDIYAMYKEQTTWTLVATVPWSSSMTYRFTDTQLAQEPWRVKAVNSTRNARTLTHIDVNVTMRHNSPAMTTILSENPGYAYINNLAATTGRLYDGSKWTNVDFAWSSNQAVYGQLPALILPQVESINNNLYGGKNYVFRNSASTQVGGINKSGHMRKGVHVNNSIGADRIEMRYTLDAYEGYNIYSEDGVNRIKRYGTDMAIQNRYEVVFYDLLPFGVVFDPSVNPSAGRATALGTAGTVITATSDAQVELDFDASRDVVSNYNGTGRTMITFRVAYTGADPSTYISSFNKWITGWQITFGATCKNNYSGFLRTQENISAFMPGKNDNRPLEVHSDIAYPDNGTYPDNSYIDFGKGDLDNDGNKTESVMYAKVGIGQNTVLGYNAALSKTVKADDNDFGDPTQIAKVGLGEGYKYQVIYEVADNVKDVVLFDRLENYKNENLSNPNLASEVWYGKFQGLSLSNFTIVGIKPVVYYNKKRDAKLPEHGVETAAEILSNSSYGWVKATEWTHGNDAVQAIAIDISKYDNGNDYILEKGVSLRYEISMKAPTNVKDEIYTYNSPYAYAYNNVNDSPQTVEGNYVRVKLHEREDLEIEKQLVGNTPSEVKDTSFEFALTMIDDETGKTIPFDQRIYKLYQQNNSGAWVEVPGVHSTNHNGILFLYGGQKAVFESILDYKDIIVVERESRYWEQEVFDNIDEVNSTENHMARKLLFKNKFRPILYTSKSLQSVPSRVNESDFEFTFKLLIEGIVAKNVEYWYVVAARIDGGYPELDQSKGDNGKGYTDDNGYFKIKKGDIISFTPGEAGIEYTLIEVDGANANDDFFCEEPEITRTLPVLGTHSVITNYYKWKDLELTKQLTHQEPEESTQEFTMQVLDENDNPVIGNVWVLLDKFGNDTATKGVLDNEGKFTLAFAGATVRIEGLEAGKTFTIKETESGALYEPVNNGIIEVKMPKYATSVKGSITNDWLMRDLTVEKIVVYDFEDADEVSEALSTVFEMEVYIDNKLLVNKDYVVYEDGKIVAPNTRNTGADGTVKIKHNESAVFKDVALKGTSYKVIETVKGGYNQILPVGNEPNEGTLIDDVVASFTNSKADATFSFEKNYEGISDNDKKVIDLIKQKDSKLREELKVTFTLRVTPPNSTSSYIWPKVDQVVNVNDTVENKKYTTIWKAGESITLKPWEMVTLVVTEPGATFELSEASSNQNRIYEYTTGKWILIEQNNPSVENPYDPLKGTMGASPINRIINRIRQFDGSEISKLMDPYAEEVSNNSRLTWRLEKYSAGKWIPEADVEYEIFYGEGGSIADSNKIKKTDKNGLIRIYKNDKGLPMVRFLNALVKINLYSGMKDGDLRLVEVMEETDPSWGMLSGYADKDGISSLETSPDNAIAFVNDNRSAYIEVAKQTTYELKDEFTIIVKQVMSINNNPVENPEDIAGAVAHGGIPYTIYSIDNVKQGTGVTTAKGEVKLKAGQYAVLEVVGNTWWTAEEVIPTGMNLDSLEGTPKHLTQKLDKNLMLLNAYLIQPIVITRDMVKKGSFMDENNNIISMTDGVITIPEIIIDETGRKRLVVGIGDRAFSDYTKDDKGKEIADPLGCGFTEIVIPNSVTSIGEGAFYKYDLLEKVTLPSELKEIKANTFKLCTALENIDIPNSVEVINESAFQDCVELKSVNFIDTPAGSARLETISNRAFMGCINIITLDLPDSLKTIEDNAFNNCSALEDIEFSSNLSEIGFRAFAECSAIKSLDFPLSLRKIGERAFYDCVAVETIDFNEGLIDIGDRAFIQCEILKAIVLPDSLETLGVYAFQNCYKAEDLYIGRSLKVINQGVFAGTGIKGELKIPNNVTHIVMEAFAYNLHITSVVFEDPSTSDNGIKDIGSFAFGGSGKITTITIPSSIETIFASAFSISSDPYNLTITIKKPENSVLGSPWGANPINTTVIWAP